MKNLRNLPQDFKNHATRLHRFVQSDLPRIVRTEGLNLFESSFDKQGWQGATFHRWKNRKTPKGKKAQARNSGRAIMVGHRGQSSGGHLKDSLRAKDSPGQIVFSSNKVYADVHNEGLRAGRGSGFQMPKRQFMGHSTTMDKNVEKKIIRTLNNIFK